MSLILLVSDPNANLSISSGQPGETQNSLINSETCSPGNSFIYSNVNFLRLYDAASASIYFTLDFNTTRPIRPLKHGVGTSYGVASIPFFVEFIGNAFVTIIVSPFGGDIDIEMNSTGALSLQYAYH